MWFSSSAGVNTSLSSMKSTSSACSSSASAKCPMRTLAITGIVTVAMISRITLIDAMRATPPSLRISEGTRSSAITAHAPAFSAIFACSALVTSMITPPLSISARPTFTRHSFEPLLPLPLPFTFFASMSLLLSLLELPDGVSVKCFSLLPDDDKPAFASRQNLANPIANLTGHKKVSSLLLRLAPLHHNFTLHVDGLQVLDRQFRRHCANLAKATYFPHRLIQQRGNNSAVSKSAATLIPLTQNKPSYDLAIDVVLLKRQLHSAGVVSAAAKAFVRRIRLQPDCIGQKRLAPSDQRHSAAFRPSHTALPFAHFNLQQFRQRGHAARNLLFIQAGKAQPQRIRQRRLHVEVPSRRKQNAAFFHVDQQFAGIESRRQLQPQTHATFRTCPTCAFRHVFPERFI